MGDELVMAVVASLESVLFANGISERAVGPVVDAIVNRMRNGGLSDETIKAMLCE